MHKGYKNNVFIFKHGQTAKAKRAQISALRTPKSTLQKGMHTHETKEKNRRQTNSASKNAGTE
ncbi:hypothetical protein NBRC116583_06750 [Arenicella sp. 4NH20-0111]